MGRYVDGYVLAIPKRSRAAYVRLARAAGKVWRDHGALEVRECWGDDLNPKGCAGFPDLVRRKPGETVVFSWIVYSSRAARDRVNAKVMKDPRILAMMKEKTPCDPNRMWYGGFETIVSR